MPATRRSFSSQEAEMVTSEKEGLGIQETKPKSVERRSKRGMKVEGAESETASTSYTAVKEGFSESVPAPFSPNERPKRIARKSVLLSPDYEVSFPGKLRKEVKPTQVDRTRAKKRTVRSQPVSEPNRRIEGRLTTESKKGRPRKPLPPLFTVTQTSTPPQSPCLATDPECEVDVEFGSGLEPYDDLNDTLGTSVDSGGIQENEEDEPFVMLEEQAALQPDDFEEEDDQIDEQMDDDQPPVLEAVSNAPRPVGRPRKYPRGQEPYKTHKPRRVFRLQPFGRPKPANEKPLTKQEADKINSFNVKLFNDDVGFTEFGDPYATVISGCLTYLLRKDRILELLTNRIEVAAIKEQGWMSTKPPRMPPLVNTRTCFAFYVDGASVTSTRELCADDLRPWTTSYHIQHGPHIKPNVRKHSVGKENNRLVCTQQDPKSTDLHLIEYSAWLPRCLRLRKKIYYLCRAGHIVGNVLILYDYTVAGDPPELLGNGPDLSDMPVLQERILDQDPLSHVGDREMPFYEHIVLGPTEDKYLRVRPSMIHWPSNKTLLLKYLINQPSLLLGAGYLNNSFSYLPPMTETKATYAHFAPAALLGDSTRPITDGLAPWNFAPVYRESPKVRIEKRGVIQDVQGRFHVTTDLYTDTGLALVEIVTVLARCPRLRKKVFYIQRNNGVKLGNICTIYEFSREGDLPRLIRNQDTEMPSISTRSPRKQPPDAIVDEDEVEVDVEGLEEDPDEHLNFDLQELTDETGAGVSNGGWDTAFDDFTNEETFPFFDGVRELDSGHKYLTVRVKRLVYNFDTILDWIINTDNVVSKEMLNEEKPPHPPLVRNARAYCFFVNSANLDAEEMNNDDMSPWTAKKYDEMGNETYCATKCRKIGLVQDETGAYVVADREVTDCHYHLVHVYSIHPRESRLRKRISYVEDSSNVIISHVMFLYDYNSVGPLPIGPFYKKFTTPYSTKHQSIGVMEDVSDDSETEKENPFLDDPIMCDNGTVFLCVGENDFLSDRNRILHYLVNKPHILEISGCLNTGAPIVPPLCESRSAFVFFMDSSVSTHKFNNDALAPWSEAYTRNGEYIDSYVHGVGLWTSIKGLVVSRRPKCVRMPLGMNKYGQLRVLPGRRGENAEYVLHAITASLPRMPRFKRRVMYVTRDGVQVGYGMIAYIFTADGDIPDWIYETIQRDEGSSPQAPITYVMPSKTDKKRLTHFSRRHVNVIRFTMHHMRVHTEEEALDAIWKVLQEKDEARLLKNIHDDLGVEIISERSEEGEELVVPDVVKASNSQIGVLPNTTIIEEKTAPSAVMELHVEDLDESGEIIEYFEETGEILQ